MKQCPYWGKEYPDDAMVCAIDQTPFEEPKPAPTSRKYPRFAFFSETKIPVSLIIISYYFYFPAAMAFAGLAVFLYAGIFMDHVWLPSSFELLFLAAVGFFFHWPFQRLKKRLALDPATGWATYLCYS